MEYLTSAIRELVGVNNNSDRPRVNPRNLSNLALSCHPLPRLQSWTICFASTTRMPFFFFSLSLPPSNRKPTSSPQQDSRRPQEAQP